MGLFGGSKSKTYTTVEETVHNYDNRVTADGGSIISEGSVTFNDLSADVTMNALSTVKSGYEKMVGAIGENLKLSLGTAEELRKQDQSTINTVLANSKELTSNFMQRVGEAYDSANTSESFKLTSGIIKYGAIIAAVIFGVPLFYMLKKKF